MSWRTFIGAVLVVVGLGFLLDRAGIVDFGSLLSTWWPLIVIFIGVVQLVTRSAPAPIGAALTLIGAALLVDRLGLITINIWALFWPAMIVLAGAYLLLTRSGGRGPQVSPDEGVNLLTLFGGTDHRLESQAFRGGSAVAIFGGIDLDLRAARLDPQGAAVDLTALFGGIEMIVPADWQVKMSGLPIFGGWDNKTRRGEGSAAGGPVLTVRCLAAFGGIEVRN